MLIGFVTVALSYFGYALCTQGWMLYPVLGLAGLGGIGTPAVQGLISRNTPANEQGAVQGTLTSRASLGQIIAPLLSTRLFGYFITP